MRAWASLAAILALPLAATAVVACGDSESAIDPSSSKSPATPSEEQPRGDGFGATAPTDGGEASEASECGKMDIVFVVDDSGSMAQEQANLATNFPKFGNIIDGYKTKSGKDLDYRLAVATTDITKGRGAFVKTATAPTPSGGFFPFPPPPPPKPTCVPGPDRAWLERGDGTAATFFACRAQVGTGGDADERPLGSLFLGLTDRIADGTNKAGSESFLRDDALLAFVVLTDEDESVGSSNPNIPKTIAEFPAAFDKLKGGERGRWAAAVIAGEQQCNSKDFGSAREAKELKSFIKEVGKNGVFSSICTGDLTEGLTKALGTFDLACKSFPGGPK